MVTARELTAAPIAIGPLDWSTARIRSPVLDGWSEPPPSGVLVVAGVPVGVGSGLRSAVAVGPVGGVVGLGVCDWDAGGVTEIGSAATLGTRTA